MILFLRTALKVSPLALCLGLTDLTLQITQLGRSQFRTRTDLKVSRHVLWYFSPNLMTGTSSTVHCLG